jgi:hypothetical protein
MKKSTEQVPHQERWPYDRGADVIIEENTIPREEINSNATFPLPKPQQGMIDGRGMNHPSHTNTRHPSLLNEK